MTRMAVTSDPTKPCSPSIAVIFFAMVSATRRVKSRPPSSISAATAPIASALAFPPANIPPATPAAAAPATKIPAIFGVSLSPRAKETSPPVKNCPASKKRCAEKVNTFPAKRVSQF